jgi:hypothetical protein
VNSKTNPLGPGKVNLTVNLDKTFRDRLLASAKASGMTLGAYVRFILEQNIGRKVERRLSAVGDQAVSAAVVEAKSKARAAAPR